jgi:hypothetical protein
VKLPTMAEASRFILIVLGVLLICTIARTVIFDGPREEIGALDVVVAIAIGVIVMGGWLRRGGERRP